MLYRAVLLAAAYTAPDAPKIGDADLNLLPPAEVCRENLKAAKHALDLIRSRESVEPRHAAWLCEARSQVLCLFNVWDTTTDARTAGTSTRWQDDRMDRLRSLVGPGRYYSGRLPPPVPLWAFPEVPAP